MKDLVHVQMVQCMEVGAEPAGETPFSSLCDYSCMYSPLVCCDQDTLNQVMGGTESCLSDRRHVLYIEGLVPAITS